MEGGIPELDTLKDKLLSSQGKSKQMHAPGQTQGWPKQVFPEVSFVRECPSFYSTFYFLKITA